MRYLLVCGLGAVVMANYGECNFSLEVSFCPLQYEGDGWMPSRMIWRNKMINENYLLQDCPRHLNQRFVQKWNFGKSHLTARMLRVRDAYAESSYVGKQIGEDMGVFWWWAAVKLSFSHTAAFLEAEVGSHYTFTRFARVVSHCF